MPTHLARPGIVPAVTGQPKIRSMSSVKRTTEIKAATRPQQGEAGPGESRASETASNGTYGAGVARSGNGASASTTTRVAIPSPASGPVYPTAVTIDGTGRPVNSSGQALRLADGIVTDGGPPRFLSPYIPGAHNRINPAELPLMVYLPGIDGTGLAASRQFTSLTSSFDLKALTIPNQDRTPFEGLIRIVTDYLETETKSAPPERPVYLLGESFGGILSLAVAAARPDLVDRIVLVNPATSFPKSVWPALGPLLPRIPKELYGATPFVLAPFLSNPVLLAAVGVDTNAPVPSQLSQLASGLLEALSQLSLLSDILPPPTLSWKLELLAEGCRYTEPKIKSVKQRVLLLASGGDLLIPSSEEGPRLQKLLPRCRLKELPLRSHALLQEAGVDLMGILKEEGFYTPRRVMSAPLKKRGRDSFGTASPLELPTPTELNNVSEETLGWLKRLTSPVYFSTGEDGVIRPGLDAIPQRRPMLFVGNHQTLAVDLGPMVEALLKDRGILVRGLAHPAIWAQGRTSGQAVGEGDEGGFASFMATFGAVPVGARNFFKLMQNGEAALLYPGGVREAYKRKGEKYRLFWPEREEFVRMGAKFGATIVPFAGIGSEDGISILADSAEISKIPVLGENIQRRAAQSIPQARRGASKTLGEELFIAPFAVPSAFPRFYFNFRKPIQLSPDDLKTEGHCQDIYLQVKQEVESGIQFLQQGREKDPYKDLLPRLAYEASWGGKQAPTFKP